jgi:hypothetical protein
MAVQTEQLVRVAAGSVELKGNLSVPAGAAGVVLFAHGSGSSRHSPRNQYVARVLRQGTSSKKKARSTRLPAWLGNGSPDFSFPKVRENESTSRIPRFALDWRDRSPVADGLRA